MVADIVLPVLDKRAYRVLDMLCKIIESGTGLNMKQLASTLGKERCEPWEVFAKLNGTVVVSFRGREGGYKILNPDITVGEVCCLVGCCMEVPSNKMTTVMRVKQSRLMDMSIQEFSEQSAWLL